MELGVQAPPALCIRAYFTHNGCALMASQCFYVDHACFRVGDDPFTVATILPPWSLCRHTSSEEMWNVGWNWAWIILVERLYLTDTKTPGPLSPSWIHLHKVVVAHPQEGPNSQDFLRVWGENLGFAPVINKNLFPQEPIPKLPAQSRNWELVPLLWDKWVQSLLHDSLVAGGKD